jgi:hypothetical protein
MNVQVYSLPAHADWTCIQVKTPDSDVRTPIHLCCVIDTSGSMESDYKLENVKQSLKFLLDFLGPQDSVSVITFSETAKTILNQIAVTTSEKDNIRTRISIIRVESNTNLSAGIIQARDSLQIDTTNIKQSILLLTDGHANLGLMNTPDIIELVHNTIDKFNGTSISCVGYGTDHNIELLQNISREGGGSYYMVNNLEDVAVVFGDILGGLVSCVAQQVRIILPANTEVKSRYAASTSGATTEIIIGDMPAGVEAAFLAKLPIGEIIQLKGFNLQTHNTFEIDTVVSTTDDINLRVDGEAHYLRFEVLTLLEQSEPLMNWNANTANVNAHIAKITSLTTVINNYEQTHTHSLWPILLEELSNCKYHLEHRNYINIDNTGVMSQHASYLGRMRGLAAVPTLRPDLGWSPIARSIGMMSDEEIPGSFPLERTFSNNVQRQISAQMAASSIVTPLARQQAASNYSATQDPSVQSILSPLPMNRPLPRLMTLGASTPPPLTRQMAGSVMYNLDE